MNKLKKTLDDYTDRTFVMSILCNQAQIHYNRIKTILQLPLIITSSVMSIINSSFSYDKDANALRIINITNNMTTALLLGISNFLKINEKQQNFKISYEKFHKLSSSIETKSISKDEITVEYVNEVILNYDSLCEIISYDIPEYIKKRVRAEYATKKTLPVIINGINKLDKFRNPSISIDVERNEFNKIESSIVYKNDVITPRVLPYKKIIDLQFVEGEGTNL